MTPCVRTYAPLSCRTSSRSPRIVASASSASSIRCRCSREWLTATRCSARSPRKPRHEEVLWIELAANTEATSGVDGVHPDRALVHAQHVGEHLPVEDGHLGDAEDLEAVGGCGVVDHQGPRLHGYGAVPADREVQSN